MSLAVVWSGSRRAERIRWDHALVRYRRRHDWIAGKSRAGGINYDEKKRQGNYALAPAILLNRLFLISRSTVPATNLLNLFYNLAINSKRIVRVVRYGLHGFWLRCRQGFNGGRRIM